MTGFRPHLPGLDGLRALACLTVFLENFHHSMGMTVSGHVGPFEAAYLATSGIGVAMFIVLSGSLISMPLWQALEAGRAFPSWWEFALRRVLRIAPAYYLAVTAMVFATHGRRVPLDIATHYLFVNNLWERSFYSIGPQFWTIGMFAQFYCIAPVLFLTIRAAGVRGRAAFVSVVAGAIAAYGIHVWLMSNRRGWVVPPLSDIAPPDGYVISHSLLAHLPLFLFGVAAGYILVKITSFAPARPANGVFFEGLFWLAAAALFGLAAMPAAEQLQLPYSRYNFPWMPGLAAVVVVAAPFAPMARRLLELWPVRALGVVSYGVYIFHFGCMELVHRFLGGTDLSQASAKARFATMSFALTVVVATTCYLVIERPLLRWSHRLRAA